MDSSFTSKETLEAYLQNMEAQVDAEITRNGGPLNLRRSIGRRGIQLGIFEGHRFHHSVNGGQPVSMG